jgi:hypothetical protein
MTIGWPIALFDIASFNRIRPASETILDTA